MCEDLESLLVAIGSERPDVALTDIRMPPTNTDEGLRVAEALRKQDPNAGVVLLSQYADPQYALAFLANGSRGRAYLLKERVSEFGPTPCRGPGSRPRRLLYRRAGDRRAGHRPLEDRGVAHRAALIALRHGGELAQSDTTRAAREKLLVVTGRAGVGETHLLCDIAVRRIGEGRPTILFLASRGVAKRPAERVPAGWRRVFGSDWGPTRRMSDKPARWQLIRAFRAASGVNVRRITIRIDPGGPRLGRNGLRGGSPGRSSLARG